MSHSSPATEDLFEAREEKMNTFVDRSVSIPSASKACVYISPATIHATGANTTLPLVIKDGTKAIIHRSGGWIGSRDTVLAESGTVTTVNDLGLRPKVAHRHLTVYLRNPEGLN